MQYFILKTVFNFFWIPGASKVDLELISRSRSSSYFVTGDRNSRQQTADGNALFWNKLKWVAWNKQTLTVVCCPGHCRSLFVAGKPGFIGETASGTADSRRSLSAVACGCHGPAVSLIPAGLVAPYISVIITHITNYNLPLSGNKPHYQHSGAS